MNVLAGAQLLAQIGLKIQRIDNAFLRATLQK
jgi:hypothetical protein